MHLKKRGPREAAHGRVCVQPRGRSGARKSSTGPRFHRERLPSPAIYYGTNLVGLKRPNAKGWANGGLCPFHGDSRPGSFFVNLTTGRYRCFSCKTKGSDVLDFHRALHGLDFVAAAKDLGAWV